MRRILLVEAPTKDLSFLHSSLVDFCVTVCCTFYPCPLIGKHLINTLATSIQSLNKLGWSPQSESQSEHRYTPYATRQGVSIPPLEAIHNWSHHRHIFTKEPSSHIIADSLWIRFNQRRTDRIRTPSRQSRAIQVCGPEICPRSHYFLHLSFSLKHSLKTTTMHL